MTKNNFKINSLRNLILLLLAGFLILSLLYKVLEWNTVKTLADLNRKTWSEELSLVEESAENQETALEPLTRLVTDQKLKSQDILDILGKVTSSTKLWTENYNNYLQLLKQNQEEYEKLKFPTSLLVIGKVGNLTRGILSYQTEYYKKEIGAGDRGLAEGYILTNTFNVWRDWTILNDFSTKTQNSPEVNYPKYWPDIAVLEKYTKGNFKFDEEDKLRQYYPENYEYLSKSKKYFSTFYQIAKDYVAGDYESAQYKWSRLNEESVEINPDFDQLFSEGQKEVVEQSKGIAESVLNLVKLLKEFEDGNLGNYPVLGQVKGWKSDLILCQMYNYKTGIFHSVTEKHPEAENVDDLLKELNQVSPRTESVDAKFDKDVLRFTNDDKEIKFECNDKDQNKVYTFKILK